MVTFGLLKSKTTYFNWAHWSKTQWHFNGKINLWWKCLWKYCLCYLRAFVSSDCDTGSPHVNECHTWNLPYHNRLTHQCQSNINIEADFKPNKQSLFWILFHQINIIHCINNWPLYKQGPLCKQMSFCKHCTNKENFQNLMWYTLLCEEDESFNTLCLIDLFNYWPLGLLILTMPWHRNVLLINGLLWEESSGHQ